MSLLPAATLGTLLAQFINKYLYPGGKTYSQTPRENVTALYRQRTPSELCSA